MKSFARARRFILASLVCIGVSSCATPATLPTAETLFNDALFAPPSSSIDAEAAFALTPEMQHYAETVLRPLMHNDRPEPALVDALYDRGLLQLEYDAVSTRSAASAFRAKAGNCLSLVIMTGAFAEYFGLAVQYQEVFVQPSWSRTSTLEMASRHINLRLLSDTHDIGVSTDADRGASHFSDEQAAGLTVDFLPSVQAARYRSRVVSRETVKAMYLNNRAAELLAEGHIDQAYWLARESIRRVPGFTDAYNLLGVIYQQHGNLPQAEFVLRRALALEPDKLLVMSNLAGTLEAAGRTDEARELRTRLARLEPYPPFYFFDQGLAAIKAHRFEEARQLFQRELRRDASNSESYLGLAVAELNLGDSRSARQSLTQALDHSTTIQTRALYSAKLDWLKSQGYSAGRLPGSG